MRTALFNEHKALGARMVPFGGWDMPVSYSGILEEHRWVREMAGLFDVSHMGEFFVSGKDACNYLNSLVPQDISKLEKGHALYCQLTNEQGGIVDDLIVYNLGSEYLVVANASKIEEDAAWFRAHTKGFEVVFEDRSDEYSLLALQGPKSEDIIKKMGTDGAQKFFTIKPAKLCDVDVLLSRSGYTGEDGFEILVKNEHAVLLWRKILNLGAKPIGLGARDTLRLEAALLLNGADMDENTTPYEAGLSWSIPLNKEAEFTGKGKVERLNKKLVGLEMAENAIARHGYEVYFENEKTGVVTSGSVAPSLGKNIALAYVGNVSLQVGTEVQVMIRNKMYKAKIVKRPFISKKYKNS